MDRLIRSSDVVIAAETVECNCPDDCLIDHENA